MVKTELCEISQYVNLFKFMNMEDGLLVSMVEGNLMKVLMSWVVVSFNLVRYPNRCLVVAFSIVSAEVTF